MSPVGHSLVGLAISSAPDRATPVRAAVFVALANLPDWPLPGWGHEAYHVSHSLPVNLLLIAGAWLILRRWLSTPTLLAGAAAWLSHLLLDSLYNHGLGVQIGWPLVDYRLNLPVPWLQTLDVSRPLSWRNASVALLELATFGPLVAASLLLRRTGKKGTGMHED